MKTLRNLFMLVLCLLMIVPTGTAFAATTETHQYVDVYVNNKLVDADVYVDNNIAWVANYNQLYTIFPEETRNFNFPAVQEASSLKNWAIRFGYTLKVTNDAVYLSNEDTDITVPENLRVYVNNVRVTGVNAYLKNDIVWLESYSDVFKVFPKETKGMYLPSVNEPTRLKSWANDFDYEMVVDGFNVYLTKEDNTQDPNVPTTPTTPSVPTVPSEPSIPGVPSVPSEPSIPGEPSIPSQPSNPSIPTIPENVKVYVNGMLIKDVTVTLNDHGKPVVSDYSEIRKIFPKETKNISFPALKGGTIIELRQWTYNFGYTCIQKGNRVYLSNSGVTPIEIYLDSALIEFPDQQPIIHNNRTMIPIRAVSETLGWNVSWGENIVTITNNYHTLILYIGKNYYTIDSVRKTMDVPAQIMNNRTMVPIRFVAEAFGYNVGYDGSGDVKVVTINR